MSRKVREREENKRFNQLLVKHGVKLADNSFTGGLAFYDDVVEHFCPLVQRSDRDVLLDAVERIRDYILTNVEDNADVDLPDLMRQHDLDPTVRSDLVTMRKMLIESGTVAFQKAKPAHLTKRITDGTNGANGTSQPVS